MKWRAFASQPCASDPGTHAGYVGRVEAEQRCHDGAHHSRIAANDCARKAAAALNRQSDGA